VRGLSGNWQSYRNGVSLQNKEVRNRALMESVECGNFYQIYLSGFSIYWVSRKKVLQVQGKRHLKMSLLRPFSLLKLQQDMKPN